MKTSTKNLINKLLLVSIPVFVIGAIIYAVVVEHQMLKLVL